MARVFANRADAGRRLAGPLRHLRDQDVVVLGLPRGGVPVAFEVAEAIGAPLDVIVVRKLGVPFRPELGMGAIGEDGVRIINHELVQLAQVTDAQLAAVERRERAELERRARRFRSGRRRIALGGKTAVVVDDGIATGSTARAACEVARAQGASRVVLAVPVAPPGWTERLEDAADELVCLETPEPFFAIGRWYRDFTQTADEDVVECLERHAARLAAATAATVPPGPGDDPPAWDDDVQLQAGPVRLAGRPEIFPVSHVFDPSTGTIVFPTNEGTKWRAALDWLWVAFEVDGMDVDQTSGWSVAVVGRADEVTDPSEITWARQRRSVPWAAGVWPGPAGSALCRRRSPGGGSPARRFVTPCPQRRSPDGVLRLCSRPAGAEDRRAHRGLERDGAPLGERLGAASAHAGTTTTGQGASWMRRRLTVPRCLSS